MENSNPQMMNMTGVHDTARAAEPQQPLSDGIGASWGVLIEEIGNLDSAVEELKCRIGSILRADGGNPANMRDVSDGSSFRQEIEKATALVSSIKDRIRSTTGLVDL